MEGEVDINFPLSSFFFRSKKVFNLFNAFFLGLGPGGLLRSSSRLRRVSSQCLSGSSHGGKGHQGDKLKAGQPYDKNNIMSLLGGSGGEIVFIILTFL